MRRDHWKRRNDALDPATDFVEIYAKVVGHEFPWDMNQALGFALFRTYAVPGIDRLLAETGEFTSRTQKRYDDTALLLEPPTRLGFEAPEAKAAIRRIAALASGCSKPTLVGGSSSSAVSSYRFWTSPVNPPVRSSNRPMPGTA